MINIAVIGVVNCASSPIQGIHFYRKRGSVSSGPISCRKLARDRGTGGVLHGTPGYVMNHPPRRYTDDEAYRMTEAFIRGTDTKGDGKPP